MTKKLERNLSEMCSNYNIKHKHLTIDLRRLIEKWKKENKSQILHKNYIH